MEIVLGLDGGVSSWGWAIWKRSNGKQELLDLGSYIFPESANAADRTLAKSGRNRRQRNRRRLDTLILKMVEYGLIAPTTNLKDKNPYLCRHVCATEVASKEDLARALIHMCKRRGYKGSHLQYDPNEEGVVKAGIHKLDEDLKKSGAVTLGSFLYLSKSAVKRFKPHSVYRADRRHYAEEFEVIKKTQIKNHSLTEDAWQTLYDIIFYQRPLKPQEKGKCSIYRENDRAYKASYIAQEFSLWQQISNIKIEENGCERSLCEAERLVLYKKLSVSKTMGEGGARKLLRLTDVQQINYFNSDKDKLFGHVSNCVLRDKSYIGSARWDSFDDAQKTQVISTLLSETVDDFEKSLDALVFLSFKEQSMMHDLAGEIVSKLPKATMNLCEQAMLEILPLLKQGKHYHEAVKSITGGAHTLDDLAGDMASLPYYGSVLTEHCMHGSRRSENVADERNYGVIPNSNVHVALNALRKVYNDLVKRYGKIDRIHVELSREIAASESKRKEMSNKRDAGRAMNEAIFEDLTTHKIKPTSTNRLKYKLWKELCGVGTENVSACECTCIYSGEKLNFARVFCENSDVEIEHILPLSRTLDDSYMNKILSIRSANAVKGNRSPYEAFAHNPEGYDWDSIVARSQLLPSNKRKRFLANAMDKYEEVGFIARALTDTQYITKVTRRYLTAVCKPENITCVNGQLTAKARHQWGVNSLLGEGTVKSREDHRHHALDAAIVALISKASVSVMSQAAKNNQELYWPEPFPNLRSMLEEKLATASVVHKKNAKDSGNFFEGTAYNYVEDGKVVYRKPITAIEKVKNINEIRDERIKQELLSVIHDGMGKKEIQQKLEEYKQKTGVRSLRFTKKLDGLREISSVDSHGVKHKKFLKPDSNVFVELWQWQEGKKVKVQAVPVSLYDLKSKVLRRPHPAAKKVMVVHKKDYIDLGGDIGIVAVTRLKAKEMLYIKPEDAEHKTEKSIAWSKVALNGKKVQITPTSIKG